MAVASVAMADTALYFNGSTYISLGKKFPLKDSVSLSAWVRVSPTILTLKPKSGSGSSTYYGAGIVGQGYWGGATGLGMYANAGVSTPTDTSDDGIGWQVRVNTNPSEANKTMPTPYGRTQHCSPVTSGTTT